MLRVETIDKINVIEFSKAFLFEKMATVTVSDYEIMLDGNLSDNILSYIAKLRIKRITNRPKSNDIYFETDNESKNVSKVNPKQAKASEVWKKHDALHGTTYIKANAPKEIENRDAREIKPWEIWRVDLGDPVGHEMGYVHYALVYRRCTTSKTYIVFPFTSKYKESNFVYQIKFSDKNVNDIDPNFLKKCKNTFMLLEERKPLDSSRFQQCVGTLSDSTKAEFIQSLKLSEDKEKRADSGVVLPKTRCISFENVDFSEKEKKLLNKACATDIFIVANNESYSYEKRVEILMNKFGVSSIGDGALLIDFTKRHKNESWINFSKSAEAIGKRKHLSAKKVEAVLLTLAKKITGEDNMLFMFVNFINKLAR